jgi:hypothetical protein
MVGAVGAGDIEARRCGFKLLCLYPFVKLLGGNSLDIEKK